MAGHVVAVPEESEGRHPLNDTPIMEAELRRALCSCKRKSAPGADGLTHQVLRNKVGFAKLLAAYNRIWMTRRLLPDWLLAIPRPLPKPGRGFGAVTAYRPVALTSCGCKLLEQLALRIMEITVGAEFIPGQLTGFRRHRAATYSVADVVAALEHARATRQVRWLPWCY